MDTISLLCLCPHGLCTQALLWGLGSPWLWLLGSDPFPPGPSQAGPAAGCLTAACEDTPSPHSLHSLPPKPGVCRKLGVDVSPAAIGIARPPRERWAELTRLPQPPHTGPCPVLGVDHSGEPTWDARTLPRTHMCLVCHPTQQSQSTWTPSRVGGRRGQVPSRWPGQKPPGGLTGSPSPRAWPSAAGHPQLISAHRPGTPAPTLFRPA